MRHILGISNDEIKTIFESWNKEGELRENFLIDLGALICGFKKGEEVENKEGIVDDIEDKVRKLFSYC